MADHRRPLFMLLCLGVAGCVSAPTAYRRVNKESAEFKEAVAKQAAAQRDNGGSAADAEKKAEAKVTREFVAREKARRKEDVAPLVAALKEFEKPRGCWAYTVTTTSQNGGKTTVRVERYDPHQPEEGLWTLLSSNGAVPSDQAQSAYREKRLRQWRRQEARPKPKKTEAEMADLHALYADFAVTSSDEGLTTYAFTTRPLRVTAIASIPVAHKTYVIDRGQQTVLRTTNANQETMVLFGGSARLERWRFDVDYVVVDKSVAPMPRRRYIEMRVVLFGNDSGDIVIEEVFSDYRRVTCYDDRFQVKMGEPSFQDFVE